MNSIVSSLKQNLMRRFLIDLLYRLGLFPFIQNTYQRLRYGADFSLKVENRKFVKKGAPDGLPLPPPRMINLVAGHFDIKKFFENGLLGASCIQLDLGLAWSRSSLVS